MFKRLLFISLIILSASPLNAAFVSYNDFASFDAAVPDVLGTINFTGFSDGTIITNQYITQGVQFTDGDDTIFVSSAFVNDGVGLAGSNPGDNSPDAIEIQFTNPINAVGAFFPGALLIEIYDSPGGTLLYTSDQFAGSGSGFFGGVFDSGSTFTFVRFTDWAEGNVSEGNVYIDDLVYPQSVPEPATILLLGAGLAGIGLLRSRFRN